MLTGGNHGDEYEGPTALLDFANRFGGGNSAVTQSNTTKFAAGNLAAKQPNATKLAAEELTAGNRDANRLDLSQIRGRVIIVPMMNYPAFLAAARVSPLDGGNMNRVFPGRADGSATEKIADYFARVLLPMADFVLDIHAGGKTLNFVPFAAVHVLDDVRQQARCEAAMAAFGAPYRVLLRELDAAGMYDTEAERQGKVFVSTELGGGGTTSPTTNQIARAGVHNFLAHAGILDAPPVRSAAGVALAMPDADCFVTAEHAGLLELTADLGDTVTAGDEIARIYDITRTGIEPKIYHAARDGILLGRHHAGLIQPGDMLAVVAEKTG